MNYLNPNKNPSGAYGNLQSYPVKGLLAFPDEFLPEFFKEDKKCAGFVNIEDDGETVTACTWDEEAYQAYIATLPEDTGETPSENPVTFESLKEENEALKAQVAELESQVTETQMALCDVYEQVTAAMLEKEG